MNTSEGALKVAIHRLRKRGIAANSFGRKSPILWPIPQKWSPNSGIWQPCSQGSSLLGIDRSFSACACNVG